MATKVPTASWVCPVLDLQAIRKKNEDARCDQQRREALQRIIERANRINW